MLILSLHCGAHDAGAALFRDFDLVAAVQQERVTRRKGDGGLPLAAMAEALTAAGAGPDDVDAVALAGLNGRRAGEALHARLGLPPSVPVHVSGQPRARALPALFYTTWDNGLIYAAGGGVPYSHHVLKNGRLTCLSGDRWSGDGRSGPWPRAADSLGLAYGAATRALGFRRNRHEGKLTGLAAFGTPVLADRIGGHFHVDQAGRITSDFPNAPALTAFMDEVAKGAAPADVAASIQHVLEETILESVTRLLHRHQVEYLALAGGVFANVRLNQVLCDRSGARDIFIFPAMGDAGLCIGAALDLLLDQRGPAAWLAARRPLRHVYLGRDYGDRVPGVLGGAPDVVRLDGPPAEAAAALLADGAIGALVDGRMEFGPRALGARSILASPADAQVNERINTRLDRTEFMPLAPAVLAEDAGEVFGITEANRTACRFMTITTAVKPAWRARIPAVVHADGTARPQIVDAEMAPLYAGVLRAFKRRTGLPVLINTSFNAHEEPIINTPDEALQALRDGRVDFLVTRHGVFRRKD